MRENHANARKIFTNRRFQPEMECVDVPDCGANQEKSLDRLDMLAMARIWLQARNDGEVG
jgi:hypothetical protein